MARPKASAAEKRARTVAVRLTSEEHRQLALEAELVRMPLATYLRHLVLARSPPKAKPARTDDSTVMQLRRIGNNLNQIVAQANAQRGSSNTSAWSGVLAELHGLLHQLLIRLDR